MWNGIFLPVTQKHRLGTGDVINHLEVVSMELIDEEPSDSIDRTSVGDGQYMFLVVIQFTDGDKSYEFIYESDSLEPSEDQVLHELAHEIEA